MKPVEDMSDSSFMNLGRWLMENTSDKEVRAQLAPDGQSAPDGIWGCVVLRRGVARRQGSALACWRAVPAWG
jgi:hypothetical protein